MGEPEPNRQGTAIVLMSGGIDSAACAHMLLSQHLRVTAVFFDYGQAASIPEGRAVEAMAARLDIPLKTFRVSGASTFGAGEQVGRNAFFALATMFLTGAPPGLIAMGLHAGTPYYDCSSSVVDAVARLVAEHTDGKTLFMAPFATWTKQDVFAYFRRASLPIELTYSCEEGTPTPCGNCASCRDRRSLGC